MDKYHWIKLSYIRAFVLAVVIVAIVALCTWKVMEASLLLEIGKWIIIAIVAGFSACLLLTPIIGALDYIRDQLYPEVGKKWWIKWIKNGFKAN